MKNAIMGLCKEIGINSVWMKEIEININKTQLTKVTSFANMLRDNSSKDKCLSLLKSENSRNQLLPTNSGEEAIELPKALMALHLYMICKYKKL